MSPVLGPDGTPISTNAPPPGLDNPAPLGKGRGLGFVVNETQDMNIAGAIVRIEAGTYIVIEKGDFERMTGQLQNLPAPVVR